MESSKRNLWIAVAVVVMVFVCCCALVVLAVVVGVFTLPDPTLRGRHQEQIERSFDVGAEPFLDLSNGAGSVTLRTGPAGSIHLEGTKEASSRKLLNEIRVVTSPQAGGLVIDSRFPKGTRTASVDLVLTVPASTKVTVKLGAGAVDVSGLSAPVKIDTGAGDVKIKDVQGALEAKTGAGNVVIRNAEGPVALDLGAGNLEYEGSPEGASRFTTGVGTVNLRLPSDLNAEVDLSTALGSVIVEYDVLGQISSKEVTGTIGSGDDASIYARSSVGEITIRRR